MSYALSVAEGARSTLARTTHDAILADALAHGCARRPRGGSPKSDFDPAPMLEAPPLLSCPSFFLEARKNYFSYLEMLAYAVKEADAWHDECRGGPIVGDAKIDEIREVLRCWDESLVETADDIVKAFEEISP